MTKKMENENEDKGFFIEGEDMSMQELLEMDQKFAIEDSNNLIKATVVSVDKDDVTVDVGMKSEMFIPIAEFFDMDGNVNVKVGDEIEVFAMRRGKSISKLSYQRAKEIKALGSIQDKFAAGEIFEGKVVGNNKGGYLVDIGVNAFMPMSQIPFGAKKEDLMTSKVKVMILEINKGNVVVSAKLLSDKVRSENAGKVKDSLEVGMKVKGLVKSIKPYGAFVDLGGIDGLLHLSDMSWVRVHKPQDVLSVGDEIEVMVLSFDDNKEKISLGLKQLALDPWTSINFVAGDVVEGKVKKIIKNGAIVVVNENIEGFVHISDLSWVKRINKVSDIMKEGDVVTVKVLNINKDERKISFGLKQIEESPWEIFILNHHKGDKIFGKVTSVTDFGVFVEVAKGLEGMIHISDLSWEKTEELTKDSFTKGEELEVVILKINNEDRKLSLGIKQKEVDPILKYKLRKNYQVEITEIEKDALIVTLEDGIKGVVPRMFAGEEKAIVLTEKFEVGQKIDVKLVKLETKQRELVFSIKDLLKEKEKESVKEYLGQEENQSSSATFGDMLSEKLKDKLKDLK